MIDPLKTLEGLAKLPAGEGLIALRSAIAFALGRKRAIAKREIGELLGYEGSNLHVTIDRLERGERDLKGGYLLQAVTIASACAWHLQELVVIPRWTFEYPANDADDAGIIFVRHNWWPRARFLVSPYEGVDFGGCGAEQIGNIRSHEYPDEMHPVYWIAEDFWTNRDDWSQIFQAALDKLATEMNDQVRE